MLDVVHLTQALITRPSVTPADAGAMDTVQRTLESLGFACTRLKFGDIENLYARRGAASPNLCFAGHTDVVPTGVRNLWRYDPFGAEIHDGAVIGRGAVDMKGGIAAWIAAVSRHADQAGSLSFLITGDEEGVATDGTIRVVEWLKARGEIIDHCIVGEPSSSAQLGDMIKVGRRGSVNATFTVTGKQGHVAYPQRALNPLPVLVDLLAALKARILDDGYDQFPRQTWKSPPSTPATRRPISYRRRPAPASISASIRRIRAQRSRHGSRCWPLILPRKPARRPRCRRPFPARPS